MTNKQMKSSCCGAEVIACKSCSRCLQDCSFQQEKTNKEKILEEFTEWFFENETLEHEDIRAFIGQKLDTYLFSFKAELREKIEERINEYDSRMKKFAIEEGNTEDDEEKKSCDFYFNQYYNRKMALKGVVKDFLFSPNQVDNS